MSKAQSHAAAHEAAHGSFQSYVLGFALSLLLTALSFGAVMSGIVPHEKILPVIVILAVAQLLVQLILFLHLGSAPDQRSNTVIFGLTGLLIAIIVAGSLWVMHNANANMMPMQMSVEHALARE